MPGLYCGESEGRSEGRKNVTSGSAPSGTEEGKATEGSDFAGELGEVKTGQVRCKHVCHEDMHLTPCSYEQCLTLGRRSEDRYDLEDGIQVLRAGTVGDNEHTQITVGLCSLVGRV